MATDNEPAPPPFDRDKIAVALSYERGVEAVPHVSAKGKGQIAQAIIDLARKHGVEIREDRDLAGLLSKFDIDSPIPLEAYAAVAEILAYIYRANDALKHGTKRTHT